jgi:hypothetical protein
MADARRMHDWDIGAGLWAELINVQLASVHSKQKRVEPWEIHPYRDKKDYKAQPIQADITVLKKLLNQHNAKRNQSG